MWTLCSTGRGEQLFSGLLWPQRYGDSKNTEGGPKLPSGTAMSIPLVSLAEASHVITPKAGLREVSFFPP